jgi:hypothetical protein
VDEPAGPEIGECLANGEAVHAMLFRELALTRKPVAGSQRAREQGRLDVVGDLAVQRHGAVSVHVRHLYL